MKLQKIIERLQKLHPKKIDLNLDRVQNLCKKIGNPQKNLDCISIIGTNGKYSTIQAIKAIFTEAKINCNIYTSPHIQKINERFVYNNNEIEDDDLANLLSEVEEINNNEQITFFEILTAAFFYGAKKFSNNITLVETGLFHRFDATNILKKNLASVITTIGLDHLDWLPKNEQTIDKIIFEKTSSLLNSNIIISKQTSKDILDKIKSSIKENKSKKIIFNDHYNYSINENNFFYEDECGNLKLNATMTFEDFNENYDLLNNIVEQHKKKFKRNLKFQGLLMPFYCFKVPYKILCEVGYFDKSFGIGGGEDIDYRIRCAIKGYEINFLLESYILHFHGKSTWDGAETKFQTEIRNEIYIKAFKKKWGSEMTQLFILRKNFSNILSEKGLEDLFKQGKFGELARRMI